MAARDEPGDADSLPADSFRSMILLNKFVFYIQVLFRKRGWTQETAQRMNWGSPAEGHADQTMNYVGSAQSPDSQTASINFSLFNMFNIFCLLFLSKNILTSSQSSSVLTNQKNNLISSLF